MQIKTSLCMISRLIWKLNDAQYVADFQQFCGIEITSHDSGLNSASEDIDVLDNCVPGTAHKNNGVLPMKQDCQDSANSSCNEDSEEVEKEIECYRETRFSEQIIPNRYDMLKFSMENNVSFKVKNNFFYYLFHLGSHLGNEEFLFYFFPYWFWNVDGFVCRRVVLVWAILLYFGQAAKDIFLLPRPSSPPVAKLERIYHLEYGMPSTHAMVGYAIPFSLLTLTTVRYVYPYWLALSVCILWTTLVCFSRMYLGMHSFLKLSQCWCCHTNDVNVELFLKKKGWLEQLYGLNHKTISRES